MIADLFQDEPEYHPSQTHTRLTNQNNSCADEVELPPLERKVFVGLKNQVRSLGSHVLFELLLPVHFHDT